MWTTTSFYLGLLLFLVLINDLPLVIKESIIYLYADDTLIDTYNKEITEIAQCLDRDIIFKW